MVELTAYDIVAAGLSVLPIDPKTKRPPIKDSETYPDQTEIHGYGWRRHQKHLPNEAIIRSFLRAYPGCWLGFACGEGSGGLEALDFDIPGKKLLPPGTKGVAPSWGPWCEQLRAEGYGELLDRLTIVETVSGGRQVYYRCSHAVGNSKLANRPATEAEIEENPKERVKGLIESRGMGGLVVCPPTPGYTFVQGDLTTIPTITDEERGVLWGFCLQFDQMPPEPVQPPRVAGNYERQSGEVQAGTDYDQRVSWEEVLEPYGYRKVGRSYGRMQLWAHPAKAKGDYSARTGVGTAGDRFYSWSPNGGTPHEKLLKKYAVFAHLYHGGDFHAAIKALAAKGFGSPARKPQERAPSVATADKEEDLREEGEHDESTPLDLPTIQHNARQLPAVTADAITALLGANDPERLFARAGKVVRIIEDKDDKHKIEALGAVVMRNEIAKVAHWVRMGEKGQVDCYPPKDLAENILAEHGLSSRFPRLDGLTAVPVLSPEGGFCRSHGYDRVSKWYVTDPGPFDHFDGDGKKAAAWLLDELFFNFPFVDDASRANTLALGLLPYVRPIIGGPTPMHYSEAPQSRTGKSLLIEVALSPSLGWSTTASSPFPEKEEELNKDLSSALLDGDQLIFYDNVKRKVSSASLEQVLTANVYSFRPLGSTGKISVPVRAIFAMTVNNGRISIDMAGRCVLIRIDAKMETPEVRDGWKHPDIRGFIKDNRAKIRAAYMAMIEEWDRAGRPHGERKKASYIEWSRTMGGILDVCGVSGFLANDLNLKGSAADEEEPWRAFYEVWWDAQQDKQVSSQYLHELAEQHKLLEELYTRTNSERGRATAFGTALAGRDGKVLDGRRPTMIKRSDGSGRPYLLKGQKQYRLLSADGPTDGGTEAQQGFVYDPEEVDPFADEE